MTDVQEAEPSTVLRIPIPKAKGFLEIDTGKLPTHVYLEMLVQGGKVLLSRGQTTITKAKYPDEDELRKEAMDKAEKNLADLYAGKVYIRGAAKEGKLPREVRTAAMAIARKMVKEVLRRRGVKLTKVKASDITKAAESMLLTNPKIIERAKKEQEELEKEKIDLDIEIDVDPNLVAAAEKRKSDKALSAKQAGKVTGRISR